MVISGRFVVCTTQFKFGESPEQACVVLPLARPIRGIHSESAFDVTNVSIVRFSGRSVARLVSC
ncbi:MAG TPA: hypothetical protein VF772_14975, partial [Terriglobales bacterium]